MARAAAHESVFQAVACPTRRALLEVLAAGESNVSELVASLEITQSAVSQQLAVLKGAGLVGDRTVGRFRYYSLRAQPLAEIRTWLDRYRAHLEHQLDALGTVLDAMPDTSRPSPRRASQRDGVGARTPRNPRRATVRR